MAPEISNGKKSHEFGRLIREMRTERGWSQARLAHRVGISAGYVGLIEIGERGDRPSRDIVLNFAQALDLGIEGTEQLLRATGYLRVGDTLIDREHPSFAQFIRLNKRLTDDQKNLLIITYEVFVGKGSAVEAC